MDNRTSKDISSRNKRRRILRYVLLVFNILLLIAAVVIAAMVLTGCSKEPETFPEAEAKVASELEAIKTADIDDEVFESFSEVTWEYDGAMVEGYINKLKDFDYQILGSAKADPEKDDEVAVTVRITTYDFGAEYLKAWQNYLTLEEWARTEDQLYSEILVKFGSLSNKDYVSDVQVMCTKGDDGNWTCNLKENEDLMNAISGGLLEEMKKLSAEKEAEEDTEESN